MRALVRSLAVALALAAAPMEAAPPLGAEEIALRDLLAEQAAAWNRGDLEGFVSVYADAALFLTPAGATRGRDEVLRRYRARYPDRRAMGRLTLAIEEVRLTRGADGSAVAARVLARWTLERAGESAAAARSGPTFLVFERGAGSPARWWIVEDVSMESEPPAAGG
jgi:uncharacterized protein (TIGR02246 family)